MTKEKRAFTSVELKDYLRLSIQGYLSDNVEWADRPTPVCLWGEAGFGKTQLVIDLAKEEDWKLIRFSLAQIEETGDLLGLPFLKEYDNQVDTALAAPDWVPKEEGPGILLIDDFNRADGRILNALMEILQFQSTNSWVLPSGWFIVLTANPHGGSYFVHQLDPAIMDRMEHLYIRFDLGAWIQWAEQNGIEEKYLRFALLYADYFDGQNLSPRSWTSLFRKLELLKNSPVSLRDMAIHAVLPETIATVFIDFLNEKIDKWLHPSDILKLSQEQMDAYLDKIQSDYQKPALLSLIGKQLLRFISELSSSDRKNYILNRFWLSKRLPNDLRLEQLSFIKSSSSMPIQQELNLSSIEALLMEKWN